MDPTPHSPEASRVEITELVLPVDTNNYGNIFGGRVLALADKCAAMVAMRHCRRSVVTASFDRVDFARPIKAGMIVTVVGEIYASFNTSLEIGVIVHGEDPITGVQVTACRALVTMVAIDSTGHPTQVPALVCTTDEQKARAERAKERRAQRVASREAW